MTADKMKKLEARGRSAFLQGDLSSATKYFLQALEKQSDRESTPKLKREKPRSKSLLSLNNNCDDQVLMLEEKRNKKNEKESDKKKKDDHKSGVEMLDEIVSDANIAIEKFPCYPMGYLKKASALIILNHWEEARETYMIGLEHCGESSLLESALYNLNRTEKITRCAANLDMKQLSRVLDVESSSTPPSRVSMPNHNALRRNRFRLLSQKKRSRKIFINNMEGISPLPQIQTTSFRRRNSSSTDTHL